MAGSRLIAVFFGALLIFLMPAAADTVHSERISFAAGASSASVKGKVKGYDSIEYMIGAGAGQAMIADLTSKSGAIYFNIFAPGKKPGRDEALFIGEINGNSFSGILPDSGDYLVQVFLVRAAARRNEHADFVLKVAITGAADGSVSGGDAKVEGTDFNATGPMPCARYKGQPMVQCNFGVKRDGKGGGSITVFWPDGGTRVLFFESNRPTSFDQSQADGDAKMVVEQSADLFMVKIGDQRFEIVEAIMAGG